jgi:hypothetical protein
MGLFKYIVFAEGIKESYGNSIEAKYSKQNHVVM